MQWPDIRRRYPNQWLLLEALEAHTEGDRRILDELAIIGSFEDSQSALRGYAELHHTAPTRDLYVFHTSRETLEVRERQWLGIQANNFNPLFTPYANCRRANSRNSPSCAISSS